MRVRKSDPVRTGRFRSAAIRPATAAVVAVAAAAVAAALALWIAPPALGVEVLKEGGTPVARFSGVESFALRHIHSVMKTPVEDYYEVAARTHLVQTQTRYRSLGAGLPSSGIGEFRREDGWFVRDNIGGRLERITVRVGRVSKQVLIIDGKEIPLRDLDTAGKALTIRPAIILFSVLWL